MIDQDKSKRITELDGIRGLAIFVVVIYHYGYLLMDGKAGSFGAYFKFFTKYFYTAIDLFFLLSGFLLGGILLANKRNRNYFKTFYTRRFFRILPIYFLSIFAVYLICSLGVGVGTDWAFDEKVPLHSYLFFIHNFYMIANESFGNRFLAVTWSLAVEEQFYLVLPLLIYFLSRKWLVAVLCICIVSAPLFRYNSSNFFETFGMVYCRFDSLFTGVLIAIAAKNQTFLYYCRKYCGSLQNILFALFGLVLLLSFRVFKLDYNAATFLFSIIWGFLLLVVVTNKQSVFSYLMRIKFLTILGTYSYGIYIYHYIILGLLFLTITGEVPQINTLKGFSIMLASLFCTFGLAYLSYHYLEKKAIAFGHKFKY